MKVYDLPRITPDWDRDIMIGFNRAKHDSLFAALFGDRDEPNRIEVNGLVIERRPHAFGWAYRRIS